MLRKSGELDVGADNELSGFVLSLRDITFRKQLSGDEEVGIWFGNQKSTGRACLIKKLGMERLSSEEAELFLAEARALSRSSNPFLLHFIGFTRSAPYCLVSEFKEESDLFQSVQNGILNGTYMTATALGIACGLQKLNEVGLVVPDLSTRNIIITQQKLPRLCYFNCSPKLPKWKAPEVLMGGEHSFESDVFGYGMILYEMLTKKDAFGGWTREAVTRTLCTERKRPAIPKDAPPNLALLIKRCLQEDVQKRPTFEEIYDEFASGNVYFAGCQHRTIQHLCQKLSERTQTRGNAKANTFSPLRYNTPTDSLRGNRAKTMILARADEWGNEQPGSFDDDGLAVFRDPDTEDFLVALETVDQDLSDEQLFPFFQLMGRVFTESSYDVAMAVLLAMERLMTRSAAIKAIVRANTVRFLPYDDPKLLDASLNVLHPIFEAAPEVFQVDFAPVLSLILNKKLEKGLILISLFAKAFNRIKDPWGVLDLLIKFELVFLKSDIGDEYLSVLFFLCFNFSNFKHSRISACRKIFVHFLNSSDKDAVQMAYKAICTLYDDLYEIPLERVEQDLGDSDLAFPAISVLLRMRKVAPHKELVQRLLKLAEVSEEATLLLLKILKDSADAAKIMLQKTDWLAKELPTPAETLRLVLAMMKFKNVRSYLSSVPQIPAFLAMLVNSQDKVCLVCLGSVCKRLDFTQESIQALLRLHFFENLFNDVDTMHDDIITQLSMNVVTQFARIGYTKEYLQLGDRLRDYVNSNDERIARSALAALCALANHAPCAHLFKDMHLDEDVWNIFTNPNDKPKVVKFINALKHFSERF